MIQVTTLHGKELYINAELIERIEVTPDTQIVLVGGRHFYVSEAPEVVAARVIDYRRASRMGSSTELRVLK
jgi:flagellar protein FlbD